MTACYNNGMSFAEIVGHELVKDVVQKAVERPAPGYVLFGPAGVGKRQLASAFAHRLLNHPDALPLVSHPDFLLLGSESGGALKVEEVRAFVEQLHQTSATGGRRVAMILNAETLTEQAANALLKDVEESRRAVYIFVTEQWASLPVTLRSRLVPMACQPLSKTIMQGWLTGRGIAADKQAEVLDIAQGAPGVALAFLEDKEGFLRWRKLAEEWMASMQMDKLGMQLMVIDRVAKMCEAQAVPVEGWKQFLLQAKRVLQKSFVATPDASWRWSQGVLLAWSLVGSSVSPRVGLEWACVSPYTEGEMPSMLIPSFV